MAEIIGTGDADALYGTAGDDLMKGKGGDDYIAGGEGNDDIRGNAGNDELKGKGGDDMLRGNDGDDTLRGGRGADHLEGGEGADTFVFLFGSDFRSSTDDDVVADFEFGVDKVDFTGHDSYQINVTEVDGDLVLEVIKKSGVDLGSITFEDAGDLLSMFEGTTNLSLADVAEVLNGPVCEYDVPYGMEVDQLLVPICEMELA